MHINFDQTILDKLTEGIIVLNHKAEVLKHNLAAEFWLPACQDTRQTLRRLIAEEITGRTQFPVAADFLLGTNPSSPTGTQAWMVKNGPQEYGLVIAPPRVHATPEVGQTDLTGHHYVTLIGDQVRQQIQEFHQAAETESVSLALKSRLTQMDGLLKEMGSLAMLIQRDQVFSSDRIDLQQLLQACLRRLALDDARAARHDFETDSSPQGSIYGDTHWLAYAFEVLLFGLVRGMAPNSHLHITARQVGDFVVVTGRDIHGRARRVSAPIAPRLGLADPVALSRDPGQLSTRMLMAQRILELHSGHLKISYLPNLAGPQHELAAPVESFSVTLLTGLPRHERSRASCNECPFSLQAQAYAQDMAELTAAS